MVSIAGSVYICLRVLFFLTNKKGPSLAFFFFFLIFNKLPDYMTTEREGKVHTIAVSTYV